jgi:anti-sigma factor RsiW
VGLARTRTRESGARRIAASPGQAVPTARRSRSRAWAAEAARGMTGTVPASTAAAASGPAAVRMPASEAQAWAKTHTEPAEAAAHTGSAADSAGAAHTGAAARTDSAAGSDRAAVHTDSGPAGRTVPIPIRAAGSSDTPLAVDCRQPSVTGFHLRVCSEAEPGPTHFQVHAPVNASAPATTSSYVPLTGIPMR